MAGSSFGARRGWWALAVLASSACGATSKVPATDGGAEDAGWQSRLADATLAPSYYSLRFIDQGAIFTLAFVPGPPGATCSALASALDAGTDFWALRVVLPSAQIGAYPVLPPLIGAPDGVSDAGAALAFLEHQDAAAKADFAFYATSGAVTVSAGPEDGGAQAAGEKLAGQLINLAFPADPTVLGACQSIPAVSCTCLDLDGNLVSVCDGGATGCCLGTGPSGLSVSVPPFEASPCGALCETDPGLDATECSSL